jgi:hypothetical protein
MLKKIVLGAAALAAVATPLLGRAFGAPLVRAGQESNFTSPRGRAPLAARALPSEMERLQVRATPVAVAKPAYEASLHRALVAELGEGVTFGAGPAPAGPTHAGITLVTTGAPPRDTQQSPLAGGGTTYYTNATCGGLTCTPTCLWPTCPGWQTCDFTCAGSPTCSFTCFATCDFTCLGPTCRYTCDLSYCAICLPDY